MCHNDLMRDGSEGLLLLTEQVLTTCMGRLPQVLLLSISMGLSWEKNHVSTTHHTTCLHLICINHNPAAIKTMAVVHIAL